MATWSTRVVGKIGDWIKEHKGGRVPKLDAPEVSQCLKDIIVEGYRHINQTDSQPSEQKLKEIVDIAISERKLSGARDLINHVDALQRHNRELKNIYDAETRINKLDYRSKTFHRILSAFGIAFVILVASFVANYLDIQIGLFRISLPG